ncbi:MAG: trypsin-like serine protease [Proteobacteria bacterium]|nr:trypsin-like serine protease [Pseudomonadota bacterium]MCP4915886.1 trypsin-like serine protease [Pseudomonadota bacterium]
MLALILAANAASPKIVNGSKESEFPSTVALGADLGGSIYSACTGNLITPRVILTAGHCGADIPPDLLVELGRAFFGATADGADHVIGFDSYIQHPDYDLNESTGKPRNDVSLLILSEEAPVDPTWIQLTELDDDAIGEEVISVGFGATSSAGGGTGTKRSATLTVDDFQQGFLISYSESNPDEAQICSGDSGGPQFHLEDGEWVQWGVHSWGDQDCAVMSGSTRVGKYAEWILEGVEQVHGTTDLCEINGAYDNGVCDARCPLDPDCIIDTGDGSDIDDEDDDEDPGNCAVAPVGPAALLGLVGLLLLRRRR